MNQENIAVCSNKEQLLQAVGKGVPERVNMPNVIIKRQTAKALGLGSPSICLRICGYQATCVSCRAVNHYAFHKIPVPVIELLIVNLS